MRISDWSSDVCSSDLRKADAPPAAGIDPQPGGKVRRHVPWQRKHATKTGCIVISGRPSVTLRVLAALVGLWSAGFLYGGTLLVSLDGSPYYLCAGLWLGGLAVAIWRASRWALWGVGLLVLATSVRSEEHTSELQSLMRISYAVFCLKK